MDLPIPTKYQSDRCLDKRTEPLLAVLAYILYTFLMEFDQFSTGLTGPLSVQTSVFA